MGFYIHSCPKMRYKGRLAPSYLLCPEVYTWHLLDEAVTNRLDASKYCRLNQDPNATDAGAPSLVDVDGVLIFYNREWMRYETFKEVSMK
jgi:arginyl-tRNA---protein transferase